MKLQKKLNKNLKKKGGIAICQKLTSKLETADPGERSKLCPFREGNPLGPLGARFLSAGGSLSSRISGWFLPLLGGGCGGESSSMLTPF